MTVPLFAGWMHALTQQTASKHIQMT